ncbi:RagB/SusD family nutrient uptake outer membrane protein, partial [Pedobacter sp. Hv1]|uniref:RagB/SusD family nutrient uptake outer membrane protein n=1 Tax=Pedobacter sp. Hv1 TaxID=1740090 RepID=UPI000AEAA6A5
ILFNQNYFITYCYANLAFEGAALHDAKRTQTNIGTLAWNANALVFPIPQRERDANKNLVQNPGY